VLSVLYLRGYTLLAAGQPKEAAAEFQRILDHPGIVLNSLVGSSAHSGLGRAIAGGGEPAKARTGCQDFLSLLERCRPRYPDPEAGQS
jgi:hypothetical protein